MSVLASALAAAAFFFAADLVYTLDHYLVHHDRERYRAGHSRHHRRYNIEKNAPQLDAYELQTYGSAAALSIAATSALSLLTGNWGFVIGATLKFVHSLVFHCYQHGWWSEVPLRKKALPPPTPGWGFATARYHAHHHAHPNDAMFTYAESWQGFDRILEWAHPWLVRFTVDGRARAHASNGAPAVAALAGAPAVGALAGAPAVAGLARAPGGGSLRGVGEEARAAARPIRAREERRELAELDAQ